MAIIAPTNFGKATVATPPTGTGGTAFTVAAGKGALFPTLLAGDYFYGVFTNAARSTYEIVKVTARGTDDMTIVRAQDGTTAAVWSTNDVFYLPTSRKMWQETSFAAAPMALSPLVPAADQLPYFTSATAAALVTLTAYSRTLLPAVDAATARTTLGAVGLTGAETIAGDKVLSGSTTLNAIAGSLIFTGVVSPTTLAANTNDYAPTGFATAAVLRISTSARWNITGLAGGTAGRTLTIHNVGTFPAVFTFSDVLSAAANRFAFGMTLGGGQSMEIQYDSVSALWRATCLPEPVGTIKEFGGGTVPAGYLARDGSTVSRAVYAALFNEIGTTWGVGDGSTTFGVGDDRRKVAVGSGGVGTATLANTVGSSGGEETHTQTTAEMPVHNHGITDPGHVHGQGFIIGSGGASGSGVGQGSTLSATTGITINNAGSGTAFNVMQPSVVVTKIIRYC